MLHTATALDMPHTLTVTVLDTDTMVTLMESKLVKHFCNFMIHKNVWFLENINFSKENSCLIYTNNKP